MAVEASLTKRPSLAFRRTSFARFQMLYVRGGGRGMEVGKRAQRERRGGASGRGAKGMCSALMPFPRPPLRVNFNSYGMSTGALTKHHQQRQRDRPGPAREGRPGLGARVHARVTDLEPRKFFDVRAGLGLFGQCLQTAHKMQCSHVEGLSSRIFWGR